MVAVIFADLSVTLNIMRGSVRAEMPLRAVIGEFVSEWKLERITVRGRPISAAELELCAEYFARLNRTTGDLVLEIEKH